ncbi:HD domain-containing protein, partial [Candidatus Omnitrophota bacterium]
SEVVRESLPSCIDWCKYAQDCVGQQAFSKYMQDKDETIKEKLIKELENYFGSDEKRITHSKRVMQFAEELLKEQGGDWHIVIPASILHDVGIKVAEQHGSTAGHYHQKEGPAIAKKILLKLGLKKEDIDEICEIIAHHHIREAFETNNFRILYDADRLVNLKDEIDIVDKPTLERAINEIFLTEHGKRIARRIYIDNR